jgi:hypothetical protein
VAKQTNAQTNAQIAKQTNRKVKQAIQQIDQSHELGEGMEVQITAESARVDDRLIRPTRTRRIPVRFREIVD